MKKYQIFVDNEMCLVQQYVTFAQIKRLAGCDNQYYIVQICEPIPDKCKGVEISEHEILDMETPDAPRFFKTVFYQDLKINKDNNEI